MTVEKCDLCGSVELEKVYTPRGTRRGLSVYICQFCGLVQSLPRIDHVEDKTVSTSGEADWGNVRYGKNFRAKFAVEMLWRHINTNEKMNVLDVGAGSGTFISLFSHAQPVLSVEKVTLIEPDVSLKLEDAIIWTRDKVERITERFEDVYLSLNTYDVVHCSHTLEHMASVMGTLIGIWHAMKTGGLLFVEVPNIEIIEREDFIEEFFIDKHLYHFSYLSLAKYLRWTDFEILEASITQENVSIVAKKVEYTIFETEKELRDARLLQIYSDTKDTGALFVKQQAERINRLVKEKRVLIWGAGRIFDLLCKAGLDTEEVWVVDKHLPNVERPQDQTEEIITSTELLIIASREYAKEIEQEARELGFACEIKVWSEIE